MGIKHLLYPILFQGYRKKRNYFEGWYYKFVTPDRKYALAFIPGISLAGEKTHSFIQVFISQKEPARSLKTSYFRFEKVAFSYQDKPFSINIESQAFTGQSVRVDLRDKNLAVKGLIMIESLRPIEKGLYAPNIMGPFAYLPFMECYHGIVSMTSVLSGFLEIDGKQVSFDGGKGYIEKDWGRSFPSSYVWLQSNNFMNPYTSLMFSYAHIPFLGSYFTGLICNLLYKDTEFRFATYNASKVLTEKLEPRRVEYLLNKGKYSLHIEAVQQDQIDLASPVNGVMDHTIKEGLSGEVTIKLFHKSQLIYEDTGFDAGVEIMKQLS